MVKSQEAGIKIEQLTTKIAELEQQLQDIPALCRKAQAEASAKAMSSFNQNKARKLASVQELVDKGKADIASVIDHMPDSEERGPVGRHNLDELETHLKQVYPEELIDNYHCLDPIEFDSDEEAVAAYTSAEEAVLSLRRGTAVATIFNGLTALLDKAADYPQLGLKVAGGMSVFFLAGLVLSPFLFLTIFVTLGTVSALHGLMVQKLLRKIYSVELHLANSYDVDQFLQDKSDVLDYVCPYLEDIGEKAKEIIEAEKYVPDGDLGPSIQKQYDAETVRVQESLTRVQEELATVRQELDEYIRQLEILQEKEKAVADVARQKYLVDIDWKKEWMGTVFLGVTPENKVTMMRFAQGNSIYYSKDAEALKNLSRLILWQSVLHMHPDYCSSIVLDYKYNGGELVQFTGLPTRCCNIAYTADDIESQLGSIGNRIRSRTTNILSTCTSIDEYNKLMEEFGTIGEYYVVVHVFGIDAINNAFLSNIRNGGRVGYFYKFYWTIEQMQEMRDQLPLKEVTEIYEITDNPVPRTIGAVRRLLNITA